MMLFDVPGGIAARRAAARGPLAPLADSLAADLEPLFARELWIPPEKARLTRRGGRCAADGSLFEFDPWSPREHRCPVCGRVDGDEAHYRWWIMGYQLWLAERAVHAALLARLRGDARARTLAESILDRYASTYASYPNRDNVLGPTRLFFSTYLESIWLLQLCVAVDLLEVEPSPLGARVRTELIAPSAALIASYDEGMSNRQVWNDAALLAAARLLGDRPLAERAVFGPSGLVAHLSHSLLSDGTWYEGENYHLFAHRGLWYGVELASAAGMAISPELRARYDEGFATPFLTALPDFTFPSRRDSQYAVSLRQWRFAELCELGLARRHDDRLFGALRTLYASDFPPGDTGRARSTAEAERNLAPSALTRADLGWRSLLYARPTLPPLDAFELVPRSVLMEGQGFGVLRRDAGRVYVALDYGHSGAGHGHPDRLNVLLVDGETRWLDDPGTGSYVDPSLHWYRSTLAHDAPLVNGRSQCRVHGELLAWEERGAAGWISARAIGIAPGVEVSRTLVAMPDYVVDELQWESGAAITIDLPLHVDGELVGIDGWERAAPSGGDGEEDGFSFLRETERATADDAVVLESSPPGHSGTPSLTAWVSATEPAEWWRAVAPGPPGSAPRRFHFMRLRGRRGIVRLVWSWRRAVQSVTCENAEAPVVVELVDGSRHEHSRTDEGWHVDLRAGGARSSIDLGGVRTPAREESERADASARPPTPPLRIPATSSDDHVLELPLGRAHYRRSEASWEEAGAPTAIVQLAVRKGALAVEIAVCKTDPYFAPARAENELDNEHPDINSDGAQLYLQLPAADAEGGERIYSWILIPESGGPGVRVTPRQRREPPVELHATWALTPGGYVIRCRIPLGWSGVPVGVPFAMDVIVNEMPRERERRRGQLVLSGAPDDFVYLRGDRQSPSLFLPFLIEHV